MLYDDALRQCGCLNFAVEELIATLNVGLAVSTIRKLEFFREQQNKATIFWEQAIVQLDSH